MSWRDTVDLFDDLLTSNQAAELAQVHPATIRSWKARGHLIPIEHDPRGRPLYRGIDVFKAERATRRLARRVLVA